MRAKMAPLAATLGARFARGPRPPPVPVPVRPNSSYNAFEAGKILHEAELNDIRAAKKISGGVKSIGGGLGELFGPRGPRGPRGPAPPQSDWRTKTANEKARAEAAKKVKRLRGEDSRAGKASIALDFNSRQHQSSCD